MLKILLALITGTAMAATAEYQFFVETKTVVPELIRLADGAVHPAPGDVAWLGRIPVVLGEPGEYRLRFQGRQALLTEPASAEAVASVVIGDGGDKGDGAAEFFALNDEQRRRLRRVTLDDLDSFTPEVIAALRSCDPERTILQINVSAFAAVRVVPPLPAGWRHIVIDSSGWGSGTKHDLSGLASLTGLRWLSVDGMLPDLDAESLRQCAELRRLTCRSTVIRNPGALAALTSLEYLSIQGGGRKERLTDASFLSQLTRLRELDLSYSGIENLDAAEGLPALARIRALGTPLQRLPVKPWPALQAAELLSTALPEAEEKRFVAAHPRAAIDIHWLPALHRTVAGADRLVLRSGGTCHRDPARERTLHEERAPARIAEALATIEIDEQRSGIHCMCCGSVTLELYEGERLLAMIAMHHGLSVRWAGGIWPGDAVLTEASSDRLCAWLAAHGADGPGQELKSHRQQQADWQRRREGYRAVVGDEVLKRLLAERADVPAILAEVFPEKDHSLLVGLRLFGSGRPSWSGSSPIDQQIEEKMRPTIDDLMRLRETIVADPVVLDGLARWCFSLKLYKDMPVPVQEVLLAPIAARSLADPRAGNRIETVRGLGDLGGAWALALLRAHLTAKEMADEQRGDGTNMYVARPKAWELPKGIGSRAAAALALARLKDQDSSPLIKSAMEGALGADAEAFKNALSQLSTLP